MASAGLGTPQRMAGELFKMMAGVDMLHVPYRGGAPAIADLIGGQVHVMFDLMSDSIQYIKADKATSHRCDNRFSPAHIGRSPKRERVLAELSDKLLERPRRAEAFTRRNH
jgi:hypothetical protein